MQPPIRIPVNSHASSLILHHHPFVLIFTWQVCCLKGVLAKSAEKIIKVLRILTVSDTVPLHKRQGYLLPDRPADL